MLRVVDTNLAFEEADEIRTLSELEWLVWSAPKDYGDVTRDGNVLRRLLQRPKRHFTDIAISEHGMDQVSTAEQTPSNGASNVPTPTPPTPVRTHISDLWTEMSALELSEGLAPARPSKNDKFRRLTIQTAHNRCAEFRRLLADSFPLYTPSTSSSSISSSSNDTTGGLATGLNATFEDLEREWDPSLNVPTIHPTELAPIVLDEWDALRDLINNAGGSIVV